MAGHSSTVVRKPNQRTRKRKAARRRTYGELAKIAAQKGVEGYIGLHAGEMAQECLDRASTEMRFFASKVNELTEDELYVNTAFGPAPHKWLEAERKARAEVIKICDIMMKLDLEARMARVEEVKAAALASMFMSAAREAGISNADLKRLGPALRSQLAQLAEGGTATTAPLELAA